MNFRKYVRLEDRLSTFDTFISDFMLAISLADAGFVGTGDGDGVECPSCHLSFKIFKQKLGALALHMTWSRSCPFVKQVINKKFEPMKSCLNWLLRHSTAREEQLYRKIFEVLDCESPIVTPSSDTPPSAAAHPTLAKFDMRLSTFLTCPTSMQDHRNELVTSGFFYEGNGEKVRCHWCDIETGDWNICTDDMHARLSPSCGFLINTLRGSEFVLQARERLREFCLTRNETMVRESDVEEVMRSDEVKAALGNPRLELSEELMKQLVIWKLKRDGQAFCSVVEIGEERLAYNEERRERERHHKSVRLSQVLFPTITSYPDKIPAMPMDDEGRIKGSTLLL